MDEPLTTIPLFNGVLKQELSPKKNHLISVLRSLEVTLTDKKKKYFDKVQALLTAWEQIVVFVSETSSESPQPAFDFLFVNTLRFVLRADWPRSSVATKTHLTVTLQRFVNVLARSENYHSILSQCRILESVVQNPWGHPVLCKILNSQEVDLNECADYFNFENGKVIVIRLEMMLQSKCEDIAVHLSKSCLHTYSSYNEDLEGFDTLDFTQDEIDYITDIYFSSLLKTKKKSELITEIKNYQLDDGLRLLQRYKCFGVGAKHNEHCKNARVWKCNKKLVELLSNTLLANAVLHENLIESQSQLEELISEWASVHTNVNDGFPPLALEMIRKFVLIAPSSKCIYPFCSFLIDNGCKEQDINQVARCLIRAINQNMNEVEQYRVNQEREKLKETYAQLSKGFLLISELFSDHCNIYKECLLTSFSLTPSRECLQKMETFVSNLENSIKTEIKTGPLEEVKKEPVQNSVTTDVVIKEEAFDLNEIFESMGVGKTEVCEKEIEPLVSKQLDLKKGSVAPAYMAEVENLKLDDSIRVDLNCILRYQRYHALAWDLEWNVLKANCEQYLEDFEKKGFDDVELKYLNLDYNQFKDQPVNYDEFCGIEKGYEQYVASPEDSEEEMSARRSGFSSADTDEEFMVGRRKKKNSSSEGEVRRGRKPKLKKSKNDRMRKSKKRDYLGAPEDEILASISKQKSNPVSLKELRAFRMQMRPLSNGEIGKFDDNHNESNEEQAKAAEELNEILEASFKSLECVEIPPVSPRFNVYDVILEDTLLPSDSDIRLPKCDSLINCEYLLEEEVYRPRPKTERKRKNNANKEKNPPVRKKKCLNPRPVGRPRLKDKLNNGTDVGHLNGNIASSGFQSLFNNENLFKKKYGDNKIKNGNVLDKDALEKNSEKSNNTLQTKDCVRQLPKVNDSFAQFNQKNIFTKSINPNANFYNSNQIRKSEMPSSANSADDKLCDSLGDVNLDNIVNLLGMDCMNTNNLNETIDYNTIDNLMFQGPKAEQNRIESVPEPENAAVINELNQTLFDFINEQFSNYPNAQMYGNVPNKPPAPTPPTNIHKSLPMTSKIVPMKPPKVTNPNPNLSGPKPKRQYNKRPDVKAVDKILGEYREMIDKFPQLQNIPAPRKRNVNPNSRPRKPRTKKNAAIDVNETIKNSYLANGAPSSTNVSKPSIPGTNPTQATITESTPVFIPEKNLCFANNSTILYNNINKPKLPNSYLASANSSQVYNKTDSVSNQKNHNQANTFPTSQTSKAPELTKVLQGTYLLNNSIQNSNQYHSNVNKVSSGQSKQPASSSNYNSTQNTYTTPKAVASETLKTLLTQGTYNNMRLSYASSPSKTYANIRQIQNSEKINTNQSFTPNTSQNFIANRQVPNNMSGQNKPINSSGVNVNMMNEQNTRQIPSSTSTTVEKPYSYVNRQVPVSSVNQASNSLQKPTQTQNNLALMNNLEVRIPRIDLKINSASNFYEQTKYTSNVNINVANNVQYSYLNTATVNTTVNQNQNMGIVNSTYSTVVPTAVMPTNSDKNDVKIPFLYATVSNPNNPETEVNNSAEVCISIPETPYSEAYFGNYLTLIQNDSQVNSNNLPNNNPNQVFYSNMNYSEKMQNYGSS